MIKINLATNSPALNGTGGSVPAEDAFVELSSAETQRQGLIRIFIILIGPIALYLWQIQNLPIKMETQNQKQRAYDELVAKNNKAKSAVEEIKKFKVSQAKLQEQINTIDNLRKDRMREVRLLDMIQKDIPEHMWLTKVELKEGNMIISGNAANDSDLTQLMDSLSKSIFLKEVNLIKTNEKIIEGTALKEFSINCTLNLPEKKNKSGGAG